MLCAKQQRETDLEYTFFFLHRRPWNEQSIWSFYYKNNERNCCPEIKPVANCRLASVVVIHASLLSEKWHQVGRRRRRHELLPTSARWELIRGPGRVGARISSFIPVLVTTSSMLLDKTRHVVQNFGGKSCTTWRGFEHIWRRHLVENPKWRV